MLSLVLQLPPDRPPEILCLGAHADDIEIGAGATLLGLVAAYPGARVTWLVLSGNPERAVEARRSASLFLEGVEETVVRVEDFRDGHFPGQGSELKECFEELAGRTRPDLVITHRRDDRHQDHRTVAELTWNHFRDHLILEYEIPKYEGDLGQPQLYVPASPEHLERKIELLGECFPSQRERDWFDDQTFRALLRLRGMECRAPSGHAEAFHASKLTLWCAPRV